MHAVPAPNAAACSIAEGCSTDSVVAIIWSGGDAIDGRRADVAKGVTIACDEIRQRPTSMGAQEILITGRPRERQIADQDLAEMKPSPVEGLSHTTYCVT